MDITEATAEATSRISRQRQFETLYIKFNFLEHATSEIDNLLIYTSQLNWSQLVTTR